MKALSLLQPWASLVVQGNKLIETRNWQTSYRGDLYIHASAGKSGKVFSNKNFFKQYIQDFNKLAFGAIIGRVYLRDIIPIKTKELFNADDDFINELTLEEKAFGDYNEGRFAWMFECAQEFIEPVPARGMLHLWDWKPFNSNIPAIKFQR